MSVTGWLTFRNYRASLHNPQIAKGNLTSDGSNSFAFQREPADRLASLVDESGTRSISYNNRGNTIGDNFGDTNFGDTNFGDTILKSAASAYLD
jgi:hypothetical protein